MTSSSIWTVAQSRAGKFQSETGVKKTKENKPRPPRCTLASPESKTKHDRCEESWWRCTKHLSALSAICQLSSARSLPRGLHVSKRLAPLAFYTPQDAHFCEFVPDYIQKKRLHFRKKLIHTSQIWILSLEVKGVVLLTGSSNESLRTKLIK